MNSLLKLSALAAAAVLVGVSAQAQSLQQDNAQAELGGAAVTPIVLKAKLPAYIGLTRAAVTAEVARARAAGEMDFAAAEVNGGVVPQRGSVSASELRLAAGRDAK